MIAIGLLFVRMLGDRFKSPRQLEVEQSKILSDFFAPTPLNNNFHQAHNVMLVHAGWPRYSHGSCIVCPLALSRRAFPLKLNSRRLARLGCTRSSTTASGLSLAEPAGSAGRLPRGVCLGDCHQVAEALATDLVDDVVVVAHPTALEMSQPCIGLGGGSAQAAALLANGMGNTVTASGPRPRLRSGRNSAHC